MMRAILLARGAYSAEDDRLFRRNVTGDSAERALAGFSTLVGHDRSRFRGCWMGDHDREGAALLFDLSLSFGFGGLLRRLPLAHRFLGFQMDSV
jgi:hypothetical protein